MKASLFFPALALCSVIFASRLAAAPPANDAFGSAQAIVSALPATVSGDAVDATLETYEPVPGAAITPYRSVWYSWTATTSGPVMPTFSWTDNGDGEQGDAAVVTVFTGTALGNLQAVASGNKINGFKAFMVTAGTTYRIQLMLQPLDAVTSAPFEFGLRSSAPPANNNFANAQMITTGTTAGTTANATLENGELSDPGDLSIWFKWTPTATANRKLTVSDPNELGLPGLEVFTGTAIDNLVPVGAALAGDELHLRVTGGTTYYIRVFSDESDNASGGINVTIGTGAVDTTTSNAFANATAITTTGTSVSGTTLNCTTESGERLPYGMGATRWMKWTASSAGWFSVTPGSDEVIPMVAVWKGSTLANLKLVAISSERDGTPAVFQASAGELFYFQCGPHGASTGTGEFTLQVDAGDDPGMSRLTNVTLSPGTVNVSASNQTVTATLVITGTADAEPTSVLLIHPDGGVVSSALSDDGGITLVSGTTGNGSYAAQLTIPKGSKAGGYRIVVQIDEPSTGGNWIYGSTHLPKDGFLSEWYEWLNLFDIPSGADAITVTGGSDTAPVLSSFSVTPAGGDTASGDLELQMDVVATDDTGIAAVSVEAFDPQGFVVQADHNMVLVSGSVTSGTWRATATIPQDTPAHRLGFRIQITDAKGRTRRFGFSDSDTFPQSVSRLERIPAGSTSSVPITNSGPADFMPPQVREVTITPNSVDLSAGSVEVKITARVVDDASGVLSDAIDAELSGLTDSVFVTLTRASGDANDGVYEASVMLPAYLAVDTYSLVLHTEDAAGNVLDASSLDLVWIPSLDVTATATGYIAWAAEFGLASPDDAPLAEPQGDGIPNLLKYAFNLDPTTPVQGADRILVSGSGTAGLPLITCMPGGVLRVEYVRRTGAGDIAYQVQFCSDPGGSGSGGWVAATGTETADPTLDANWERVHVDDVPPPGASRRFGRVRVMRTAP